MQTLRETIAAAEANKVAVGHFNVSDSNQFNAVVNAAQGLQLPIIIGVSEGERDFIGLKNIVALVHAARAEGKPVYLNADHTYSVERVKEAIDTGFDAVIFDGAKLSFEENVRLTKECVAYARSCGRDVLVEAELGYIGTSSKVLDEIPEGAAVGDDMLTKPELLKVFVAETGIDLVAPAVGNIHGMLRSGVDPKLNIDRVKELRVAGGVPLVLHGGSGNSEEDFAAAIAAGVAIVHINTEIRLAYRTGITAALSENPDEVAPYKFLKQGVQVVEQIVGKRLRFFSRM